MRKNQSKSTPTAPKMGAVEEVAQSNEGQNNIQETTIDQPAKNELLVIEGGKDENSLQPKNEDTTFEMIVVQQKDGDPFMYAMKFTLPVGISADVNAIMGTALDSLFKKMAKAKQFGTKLFDSKVPLDITIKSSQFTIELGKIEQVFLNKLKLNNGVNSQLRFIDRMIVLANDLLAPVTVKRITDLHEDAKQAYALRYGREAKTTLLPGSIKTISEAVLVVDGEGDLVEA